MIIHILTILELKFSVSNLNRTESTVEVCSDIEPFETVNFFQRKSSESCCPLPFEAILAYH